MNIALYQIDAFADRLRIAGRAVPFMGGTITP